MRSALSCTITSDQWVHPCRGCMQHAQGLMQGMPGMTLMPPA